MVGLLFPIVLFMEKYVDEMLMLRKHPLWVTHPTIAFLGTGRMDSSLLSCAASH